MEIRQLRISLILLAGILAFGTVGYTAFEAMTIFDAFYMTLITISTVGFSEIKPLTEIGRTITIIIIFAGISVGTYAIGTIARIFIEGELTKFLGRRSLAKQIATMLDHYIVCGYGRIGKIICRELDADDIPFVVIDHNPDLLEELEEKGYPFILMDATSEDVLKKAGLERAKGIVTAVNSDAHNVYITLTAKGLRPDIFVLARASDINNESKLMRAGATHVVSPYLIGGRRMVQVLKRPTVVDFIDIATMGNKLGLMMEEAVISPASDLVDKTLIQSNLRRDFGVIIVAIKRPKADMIFNPLPSEKLQAGDVIVVIGKREALERMRDVL